MGMQLNIKSDEAYRLAARLAELTGQSLTTVVTEALRLQVEEKERARAKDEKLRRILTIAAEMRDDMLKHGPLPPSDHHWLYDDKTGLPI